MKDKMILFIIGLLVGAIISTGTFYAYMMINNSSNCSNQPTQMSGGNPPSMPNGENGQPPEMPNGNNSPNNNQTSSN